MTPRGDLGDDAAVRRVQLRLGGDDVRPDLAVRRDDGGRRLVARDVSMPEDQAAQPLPAAVWPASGRVSPHDQGVLAVVRVVAAADAARLEAEPLVECDRARVRDAHLQRVPAPARRRSSARTGGRAGGGRDAAPSLGRERRRRSSRARRRRSGRRSGSRRAAPRTKAPRQIDDGLASSPANIERDHGVGYALRSISSIAERSRSSRRRISIMRAPARRRGRGGRGLDELGGPLLARRAAHGSAPAARAARSRPAARRLPAASIAAR